MSDRNIEEKSQSSVQSYLYASDKERLRKLVDEMAQDAARSIEKAVLALRTCDLEAAQDVISGDDLIDEKEEQVDQECLYSIAMRQPVREDLRFVYAVMKIIVDLERIGDQAVNIAMNILDMKGNMIFSEDMITLVEEMAGADISMLREVMGAFGAEDAEVVCHARERRKTVKDIKKMAMLKISEYVISEGCSSDEAEKLRRYSYAVLTLRHLSRISDHILNLAERISFIATGISPLILKRGASRNDFEKAGEMITL